MHEQCKLNSYEVAAFYYNKTSIYANGITYHNEKCLGNEKI